MEKCWFERMQKTKKKQKTAKKTPQNVEKSVGKNCLNDRHSLFMAARGVCLNGVKFLVIERDELFGLLGAHLMNF